MPSIHCACPDCIKAFNERMALIDNRAKLATIERLWQSSGLAGVWRQKTFDSFDWRLQEAAYTTCRHYAEEFQSNEGQSILLYGKAYGVGKTHLAVAIGNYILSHYLKSVVFTTGQDLLLRLRATFSNRESSEYDLLRALRDADLLIVDDIGKEKSSEYVESVYYQIVNARYVTSKPLVLTTNTPWEQMGDHIGYAAMSRLTEMCKRLEVSGKDYRVEKAGV